VSLLFDCPRARWILRNNGRWVWLVSSAWPSQSCSSSSAPRARGWHTPTHRRGKTESSSWRSWSPTWRRRSQTYGRLRLELDGTFRATFKDKDGKHELYEGKYQVVGKALAVTFGRALEGQIEILSVTAKELVIRTRMFVPLEPPAEYKLERQ
jgi:hypothetical protein